MQFQIFGLPLSKVALAQTGQVPPGANSIRFFELPGSAIEVLISGQLIPLVQVGATANYDILAGDISSFAGQTGELRFQGAGTLDDIRFSTQAVPEPSTVAILAAGAVYLGWRSRRRRKRS